jgi:hypothetical protein
LRHQNAAKPKPKTNLKTNSGAGFQAKIHPRTHFQNPLHQKHAEINPSLLVLIPQNRRKIESESGVVRVKKRFSIGFAFFLKTQDQPQN